MKYFILVIFFVAVSCDVFALQLRLTEINSYRMDVAEFRRPDKPFFSENYNNMLNRFRETSFEFKLSDFSENYYPLNITGYINVYCDSDKMGSFLVGKNTSFLTRPKALGIVHNPNKKIFELRVSDRKSIKYKTNILKLSGRLDVNCGKLKFLRYQLNNIPKKADDGLMFSKQDTLDGKSRKIIVNMGTINNYYIGIDDITESKLQWLGPFKNKDKNMIVFPKIAENDPNLLFTVVYATQVKKEVINVDFSVPLKWKAIRIPNEKGTKLVPLSKNSKK